MRTLQTYFLSLTIATMSKEVVHQSKFVDEHIVVITRANGHNASGFILEGEMVSADPVIRKFAADDLTALATLVADLGYEATADALSERMSQLRGNSDHYVDVAEVGGEVLGFALCYERPAVEKPMALIVQAIVIDEKSRSSGLGSLLMDHVESRAIALGINRVYLSSNVDRTDAHTFYTGRGNQKLAEAGVFERVLKTGGSHV